MIIVSIEYTTKSVLAMHPFPSDLQQLFLISIFNFSALNPGLLLGQFVLALSKQSFISDNPLDLRSLLSIFASSTFKSPSNNALFDQNNIIFLGKIKQFPDLVDSLGS